jgi:hypothetical protein
MVSLAVQALPCKEHSWGILSVGNGFITGQKGKERKQRRKHPARVAEVTS